MGSITQTFLRVGSRSSPRFLFRERALSFQSNQTIPQQKSSPTWMLQKSVVVKWSGHHRCLSQNISEDEEYLKLAERFRNDPMAKGWVQDIQTDFENEFKSEPTASGNEKMDSTKATGEPGTANEGIVFQTDSDSGTSSDSSSSDSDSDTSSSDSDSDSEGDSGSGVSKSDVSGSQGASGVKSGSKQGASGSMSVPEITETTEYIIKQVIRTPVAL